ncbi:hypothetical protein CPB84DRAFT_1773527 [Gymnopilus junonius]|uniref:F-box domain-containing protein n=1 Tax=Gymnopilus junonius TaxID=109634 RepID=A0A9P5TQS3_GYMJU|nr:hypothetical protein CPB84DRAFT_1773527 [Gymnopilus junonius]
MTFRILDLLILLLFVDEMKWTLSSILVLSVFSRASELRDESVAQVKPDFTARAKRLRAARAAKQALLEEKQRQTLESRAFRFEDLPVEVRLLVLAHCADWPATYQSLVRVSSHCQRLTFHACLPRLPVKLISPQQVHSFDLFLHTQPKLACLMYHMWITPLKEELLPISISIVKKCNNLRSLASNAYILQESITLSKGRLSHENCTDLTLLATRTESWTSLLNTANGSAFFHQLTHLRLIGDQIPRQLPVPGLTHFSYGSSGSERSGGNASIGLACSRTKRLEIWCDNANRTGMWELCADGAGRSGD